MEFDQKPEGEEKTKDPGTKLLCSIGNIHQTMPSSSEI